MQKEKFIKTIGSRVRKIRTEKGMSLYRLSKNTRKPYHSVYDLEKGKFSPSLYFLSEVANGLSVSIEELVKGL